ncbi:hypothetical protein WMY93_033168, partial [Mugilogobius chulae]
SVEVKSRGLTEETWRNQPAPVQIRTRSLSQSVGSKVTRFLQRKRGGIRRTCPDTSPQPHMSPWSLSQ